MSGYYCKARGVSGWTQIQYNGVPKSVAPVKPAKKPKFQHPNKNAKQIHKNGSEIFYDDNTFRHAGDYELRGEWDVVLFPRTNHFMLLTKDEGGSWECSYDSDKSYNDEIKLASTLARKLADNAAKRMLEGDFDEKPNSSDEP